MKNIPVLLCLLACAQWLSGCAWLKRVIEGTETLKDQPVTGLHLATVDGSEEVCAGAPIQLQVKADIEGKEPLTTWSYGPDGQPVKKGHLVFEDFAFSSNLGGVNPEEGILRVPNTGIELLGQAVKVKVSTEHAPAHTAELSLKLHFGCGVVLDYSGTPGEPGRPGDSGYSGGDGRSESSSGSYARPGGDGQNGTDGGHGGNGGPGSHGHNLVVDMAKIRGSEKNELVLVQITDLSAGNSTRTALVDLARGGRVAVRANGGSGGQGGSGGIGGMGGHGGTGAPAGNSGNGGNGGNGGDGGDGGNGGSVVARYDTNHRDLINFIEVYNEGGSGGMRGGGGPGGSGPAAYSGGQQGFSGRSGQSGHDGRPGSSGPPVRRQAVPRSTMFPKASGLDFI